MKHDTLTNPKLTHKTRPRPFGLGGLRPPHGERTHLILWDSVQEQLQTVAAARPSYISFPTSHSFEGRRLSSWSEVIEATNKPWQDGLKIIEDMLAELAKIKLPQPKSVRRRPVWSDEDGDDFNLDRFVKGQPYWRTTRRREAGGPQIITMLVHIGGNAYMSPSTLMWRGATAVAIANILETQGYRAEIMAFDYGVGTFKSGDDECQATWVKRTHEPLDLATLVNAISGWYFRTVMFGGYDTTPGQTPTYELGSEQPLPKWLQEKLGHDESWLIADVYDKHAAVRFGEEMLRTLAEEQGNGSAQYASVNDGGVATW